MSKPFYPATLRNTLGSVFKGTYKGFNSSSDGGETDISGKPGN